ncbi:uncharacterized protein BKA78DRAFT_48699 [Phyllosticta capitalensis]|uniref:uncharacterized protein n=1 Tax=Phyllosticta capitalensis TaxID=121624 RepID=UPI0031303DDC
MGAARTSSAELGPRPLPRPPRTTRPPEDAPCSFFLSSSLLSSPLHRTRDDRVGETGLAPAAHAPAAAGDRRAVGGPFGLSTVNGPFLCLPRLHGQHVGVRFETFFGRYARACLSASYFSRFAGSPFPAGLFCCVTYHSRRFFRRLLLLWRY